MWPNRHLGRYMCCSRPAIPLTAMVLAGRGLDSPEKAKKYLDCDGPLPDPFLMTDMAAAKARIALALERGEAMAVFGDYDVDGVTATCLLTDFLRKRGSGLPDLHPRTDGGGLRSEPGGSPAPGRSGRDLDCDGGLRHYRRGGGGAVPGAGRGSHRHRSP